MPTTKTLALDSTLQNLIAKMQLVSNALDPTVQRDWDEDDPDSMAYIKNKPTGMWGTRTKSGNPLLVKTNTIQTALATKLTMSPVQDLHGYENPWPAGGGKNVICIPQATTQNGVIVEMTDAGEIWIHGTPNIQSDYISFEFSNMIPASADGNTVCIEVDKKDVGIGWGLGGADLNLSMATTVRRKKAIYNLTHKLLISVRYDVGTIDKKYKFQVTITNDYVPWTPYSNICPISGRSGVEIKGCGKNLVNTDDMAKYSVTDASEERWGLKYDFPGTFVLKVFTSPSSNSYIFARKRNSDGTLSDVEKVTNAKSTYVRTITVNQGESLYVYNGLSNGTKSTTVTTFNDLQLSVTLGTTEPTTYESYQQSNDVTITFPAVGKNLGDPDALFIGSFREGRFATGTRMIYYIPVNDGETYTISRSSALSPLCTVFTIDKPAVGVSYKIDDVSTFINHGESALVATVTIPTQANWLAVLISTDNQVVDFQIEKGSQATTYEPYTNTCYGGTLDVETGVLVVDRIKLIVSSCFNVSTSSTGVKYASASLTNMSKQEDINNKNISSAYKFRANVPQDDGWFRIGRNVLYVYDDRFVDKTTADNILVSEKPEFVYELATPITIQLTPAEVQLLKGVNNIWTDGNIIELTYVDDEKNISSVASDLLNIDSDMAPVESSASSNNYSIGDYLTLDGVFCKVISPIEVDDDIVIGVNVVETTIGAELKSALSS